jgi:hypothetical protein
LSAGVASATSAITAISANRLARKRKLATAVLPCGAPTRNT